MEREATGLVRRINSLQQRVCACASLTSRSNIKVRLGFTFKITSRISKKIKKKSETQHAPVSSPDSSVGIATGYLLDGRGSIAGSGKGCFSDSPTDRPWAPPSLLYDRYRSCFPGVRHSPPSKVEVFITWCLIKYSENFAFYSEL
jgi:hypothetical protein